MVDILRIEAQKPPPAKKETLLSFSFSFLMVFLLGFIFRLYDGYEVINAAKDSLYLSTAIMIGSTAGFMSAYMRRRQHNLLIDGQYLYLNLDNVPVWQVRLSSLVNISIDQEYPPQLFRLRGLPMVRLKGIYDTYSFKVGIFDKDAIDLMIRTAQKYNPSFHLISSNKP